MDDIIKVQNANDAPVENVQMPTENAGIGVPTGVENGFFPQGADVTNPGDMNQGLPTGQTSPVETPQGEEINMGEGLPEENPVGAKEDPSRMQYWQSQADKAKHDNFKLQQELEYYQNTLGPIAGAIQEHPDILDTLEQRVGSSGQYQGSPTQGNQGMSLKTPEQPQKPDSYNEVDAFNDPESKSWEYRKAKEKYTEDMLGYYANVEEVRQQQQQLAYQQQQEQMVVNQAHGYAINNFGWDAQKSADFVRWSQNPSNVTMEHLAKIYEMTHSPNPEQVQAQQKAVQMQQQKQRMNVPQSATVNTGKPAETLNDEQAFSAALLNRRR